MDFFFLTNIFFLIYYFIYLFLAVAGLSLLGRLFSNCGEQRLPFSCGAQASHCSDFYCCRAHILGHTGSVVGVAALGLNCPVACGIAPDQGLDPCPLLWQVDSSPLSHQGSPDWQILKKQKNKGIVDLNEIIVKAEEWSWSGKRWSEKTWHSVRVGAMWVMSKSWQRTKVPEVSWWQRALVWGRHETGNLGCWVDLPPGHCLRESRT